MRPVLYTFAGLCLFFACATESRPSDIVLKSSNEQSLLRDYTMPPTNDASSGIIISDVIGRAQNIAIFSGLTRDIDAVSGRLEDESQNATVLAPENIVMKNLKRKPWEDPEEYNQLGAQAYEGTSGSDRAHSNLERFVKRHIVPESPWEEGMKVKTLAGNEVWWESKDGQKMVSDGDVVRPVRELYCICPRSYASTGSTTSSNHTMVRWPSWLWRQVKVSSLALLSNKLPGHESGASSSLVLIIIVCSQIPQVNVFCLDVRRSLGGSE